MDGPAEIAGVINGDMESNEMTTGNTRSLFNGKAVVILRSTREAGNVTLTVKSPNRKPVKVTMATHP